MIIRIYKNKRFILFYLLQYIYKTFSKPQSTKFKFFKNNNMKGGKKGGFSFGQAMFTIKDVQSMYQDFDTKIEQPKKTIEIKPKIQPAKKQIRNPLVKKQDQKPKIILKNQASNAIKPIGPTASTKNVTHLIAPKKQEPKAVQKKSQSKGSTFKPLNSIKVNQNTFQVTQNKKPTLWSYHMFKDEGKVAQQIVPNPQIKFNLTSRNIKQGSIGNCYFICSLAALTQNIDILKRRIPNFQKYNEKSQQFKVNMFQSGKYVEIIVQNLFQDHFSKPIENDITSLILQKAYAQLYGNYEIINMGHSIDAFRDLSGSLAEYIDLKDQKCFKQIIYAFQNRHPMVIASRAKPQSEFISGKHSYNVLSYCQKNQKTYLQLRDPRGWSKSNFKIPSELDLGNQNGQFWVGYEDLVANFQVITVSRFIPNAFYYYKTFNVKQVSVDGVGCLGFEVDSKKYVSLSIHQKHKKFYDENYKYNVVNLMICQVSKDGKVIKAIKTNFNSQQVCSLSLLLEKGNYAIIGQIYPFKANKTLYPQQKITLSVNSDSSIESFKLIQNFNIQQALISYIQQSKKEFKQLITKQNLYRYHGSLFGKMCILYQNKSGKQVLEQLEFQTQNIEIKQRKIKVEKDQVKLVTYPIGPANNCSHKCVFKSKTYYSK